MSKRFEVGDHVIWNSEAGHVSGRIIKVHTVNAPPFARWLVIGGVWRREGFRTRPKGKRRQ